MKVESDEGKAKVPEQRRCMKEQVREEYARLDIRWRHEYMHSDGIDLEWYSDFEQI
jgi:hypothetical protein